MNRTQYTAARKLIRANGAFARRWLPTAQADAFLKLQNQRSDDLKLRANGGIVTEAHQVSLELMLLTCSTTVYDKYAVKHGLRTTTQIARANVHGDDEIFF